MSPGNFRLALLLLLLGGGTVPAPAVTVLYWDANQSSTYGGDGNWNTTNSFWTPNASGGGGYMAWANAGAPEAEFVIAGTQAPMVTVAEEGITLGEIYNSGPGVTIKSGDNNVSDILNFSVSGSSNNIFWGSGSLTGTATIDANLAIANGATGTASYMFTNSSGSAALVIGGNISLAGADLSGAQTINFNSSSATTPGSIEFDGTVGAAPAGTTIGFKFGGSVYTNNPLYTIKGANTNVTGPNLIYNGTVAIGNSAALGSGGVQLGTSSDTTASAVRLLVTAGGLTVANAINTWGAAGAVPAYTLGGTQSGGTSTFTGNVTLANLSGSGGTANLELTAAAGGTVAFSGEVYDTHTTGSGGTGSGNSASTLYSVTKTGVGTVILSGANAYGGGTTVYAGTLLANNASGSATSTGIVTVAPNGADSATFGGAGSVTGAVFLGGGSGGGAAILAPGTDGTLGTLATGALSFVASSSFHFDLNTSAMTSGAVFAGGNDADLLHVTGGLTLGSGIATFVAADLGNATLALGDVVELATFTGSASGYFQGLADGSSFTLGSNTFQINYGSLSGYAGAITLETVAVPEPAVWPLAAAGICGLALLRRRSRRGVV